MRKIKFSVFFIFLSVFIYAGDIANFVNLGFSPDGNKFAFGEHGLTDNTYRAYGEIYCVDVKANSFLPQGIFRARPTAETANKESKSVFLSLLDRANYSLAKWNIKQKNEGRPLFVLTNATLNETSLSFRDFETNDEYLVILHKDKKNLEASFYISVEIIKPNGSKIVKEVGNKNKTRRNVKDYAIKKIIIDNTNTSLIFVIEKHMIDKTGDSIRYMVEALKI